MSHLDVLRPCPRSPNCVCSNCDSDKHRIEPIQYSGAREEAMKTLIAHLGFTDRVQVKKVEGRYLHAIYQSRVFRWKDDVEFVFCDKTPVIHVRSASRVGWSDFGVNRKRIEALRVVFS